MKRITICMNCGKEEFREIWIDDLGEYICCSCGSTSDAE